MALTPRIAIALTTCDRPAYTSTTLGTFLRHNEPSRFVLLHADDASQDSHNIDMAAVAGFETIHAATERQGQMASIRALVAVAEERGCDYTLILCNDMETARPFPWDVFDIPGWDSLRLFGTMKARSGPRAPASPLIMGTGKPIEWAPLKPGYDYAPLVHWTPCSVTRTARLVEHMHLPRAKDVMLVLHMPTVRVVDNVVFHIGDEHTPSFKP